MKIKIYISGKEKIVELFQITYETSPERFLSLRASNGSFPVGSDLDYKDLDLEIKSDFLIKSDDNISHLKTLYSTLEYTKSKGEDVLKNNWFCFKAGTLASVVSDFINEQG